MPNRIIKESIRTSDTLASVSAEAERLFWRLVTSADDFGRFDARLNTVLGQCLSPFIDQLSKEQVEGWLAELQAVELIRMYAFDDQPYLELTKWNKHQRPRAKASKFPAFDDEGSHPLTFDSKRPHSENIADNPEDGHLLTNDSTCLQTKTNDRSNVFENENVIVFENVNENEIRESLKQVAATSETKNRKQSSLLSKDSRLAKIAQLYQQSGMGQVDNLAREFLCDWIELYSDEWIEKAFREAVIQNKRKAAFVNGVLQNWHAEGGMKITVTAHATKGGKSQNERTRASTESSEYGEDVRNAFFGRGDPEM